MVLIDFDEKFQEYLRVWMNKNRSKYKTVDEMEAQMPDVYTRWLNAPAKWLDGQAPGFYFDQYSDAQELTQMMVDYMEGGVAVPFQLLDRITDMEEDAEQPLMMVVSDDGANSEARMTAIGLLRSLDSQAPKELYFSWLRQAQQMDELIENAVESLKNMGDILEPLLSMQKEAAHPIRVCIADMLSNFPGEMRVFEFLQEMFGLSDNKALFASFLGKFGDERAIPLLEKAIDDPNINYLDYIEIVNAISQLGGEVTKEREFAGDPYYESLKQM